MLLSVSSVVRLQSSRSVQTAAYCMDLVKKRDYDHFLTTLLLPREARRASFAIRALNAEVAGVRDVVTNKAAGQGRMVFWRQTLNQIYEGEATMGHPVASELRRAIREHGLSKEPLMRLIDSRDTFLDDELKPPFDTMDEVDAYAEQAFSSIHCLVLETLAQKTAGVKGHARHAANQLGKAEGLVTLLRSVPYTAAKLRRVNLPGELLVKHQVPVNNILNWSKHKDSSGEDLQKVVETVAARADDHLNNCRFRSKYLSDTEKLVLLPAVSVDRYLATLHKVHCDVFNKKMQHRDSFLPVALLISKFKRTY